MLKVSSNYHVKGYPRFRPVRFIQAAVSSKNKAIKKPQAVCTLQPQSYFWDIILNKYNLGFIRVI